MKRLLCLILCILCCLPLGACSQKEEEPEEDPFVPFVFPIEEYHVNPLTGQISKDDFANKNRPVAVMINNIKAALPQYGINQADVIYEVVAEGGITRMIALFSDYRQVKQIGSVRSARPYYLQLAASHKAILFHYGTSTQAKSLISQKGLKTVDGMVYSRTAYFFDAERDKTYSREHCSFTGAEFITAGLAKKGYSLEGESAPVFNFISVLEPPTNITYGKANTITWDFSSYGKGMKLIYNPETLEYEKHEYGNPQIDMNDNSTLSVDNVFILFDNIYVIDNVGHMGVDLDGGKGYYFTKGTYMPIVWEKSGFDDMIKYYDTEGNELKVNVGQTYIAIVSEKSEKTLVIQ